MATFSSSQNPKPANQPARSSSPLSANSGSFSHRLIAKAIVGGTALAVGIGTYFSYQTVRSMMLDNLKQNALAEVRHSTDELDSWLAGLKIRVDMLANTEVVRTVNWQLVKPYLKSEDQRLEDFSLFGLTRPDGWRESTTGKPGFVKDRPWFRRAMAGEINVGDPMTARATGTPSIAIAAPIRKDGDANGSSIGVAHGLVSIDWLRQVTQQLKYKTNSYAFTLNSNGQAIVHPNPAFMSTIDTPAPSLVKAKDPGLAAIAKKMVDRQQGIELVTIDQNQGYVAFLPLKEANWSIALVIPRATIESQLQLLDGIALVVLALVGTLIGVLVYVQSTEQSQLKKSKLAADSANQAKSEFLANMSHELRTPLNGILGYAQILSRSKSWGEKEQRGVNIIHQCGSHLLTLINDILDLAKIEARKLELAPEMIHFPSFLQSVVEICHIRAEQKGIEFRYEPDSDLPEGIAVDEKRLRQVLLNLLGNAIKFTDKGSVTLRISKLATTEQTTQLRFTVADTGVGIAPEDVSRLFQAFEQVGAQNRKTEGTGLGLVISQQIVQLMEGQIQVKSQPGVGSDFYFDVTLPLAKDWSQQQNADVGNILGYEGAQRHILVVDDRWENRSVLMNLLEPLGFLLTEAEHGQAGLEQMRQNRPDLVITDLAMPVMDGFEFLRQLRADEALASLKVIVSSASVAQVDQQMSLDAGGDDFLAKPVQMQALVSLLEKHLQLTWKVAESVPESLPLVQASVLVAPPVEELQTWLTLVQEGRLKKLITAAEALSQQDNQYQPFAQTIIQLARQFQSEQLEQVIQNYIG